MEIKAFFILVVPFIIVFYLAFLLFIQPPRMVAIASLLGGLLMALINLGVDLLAYYLHWWHYTLNNLLLHVPLPFYITPFLIYGGLAYLLIWRFWQTRWNWLARVLLYGVPIFGILRDIYGAIIQNSYIWDNRFAVIIDIVMWIVMFYAGLYVFQRLTAGTAFIPPTSSTSPASLDTQPDSASYTQTPAGKVTENP